jgi:N4-gp56 family major capsid protein
MSQQTDTSVIDPGVANYYDRRLLRKAMPRLIHSLYAQTKDLPSGESTVIKFRRYSLLNAATTPLTEGVTPSGSTLAKSDITATVAQYGDYVTMTDKLLMTTTDPVLAEASNVLAQQAGNTLDQLTRDVIIAGTTIQYASTAAARTDVTAAMKLNLAEIQEAVRTLKNNNADKITEMIDPSDSVGTQSVDACYIGFVHPNTSYDLKNATGFTKVKDYAQPGKALPGEIGTLDEVRFIESTNAKSYTAGGSGGADVYATLIIAADFYGQTRIAGEAMKNIIKPLGSGGSMDPLDQRQTSGWKATFVACRLNEAFAVRIEHGVTA